MKRFVINEEERKNIKRLYNIYENDSKISDILTFFLPNKEDEGENKDDKISSDSSSKKSSLNINQTEVKGLNTNENIVFQTLKDDGFTDEATAAVMGVVGGESGFKTFKEASYRNTSNSRIRAIFPSKFGKMSDSKINQIKKSDEDFFNVVYGGMFGNAPNEGYKYVGRGFNGITFKGNYKAAQDCTGISFVSNPELMEDPSNAAKALSCYFKKVKDIDEFENAFKETYLQNAGPGKDWEYYANSTNPVHQGGIDKKRKYAKEYYDKIIKNPS